MTGPELQRDIRAAFDAVAADYAAAFRDDLAARPLDRALLAAFVELTAGLGPIGDLGCGPGHVTAHLAGLGADVVGIDLSPGMVAIARQEHPGLSFEVGSMTALDLPGSSLGGVLAWYSVVNLPADRLPAVFAEFHRVLVPGGQLLVAFQSGDEVRRGTEWFGHPITLAVYRRQPEQVAELLTAAGFQVHAQLVRRADPTGLERGPRAHLLAAR